MTDAPTHPQQLLADRYRIEREIGHGGMARVYLAHDLKHDRAVAIKMMRAELTHPSGPERFEREIDIAAHLTHPHILALHDSGTADGRPFYVMPYIEGVSLRARLDRERQLPLEDALRLTREIASALGHAHHRGLVHRDIKPENVLLADGIALVADFGIARARHPTRDSAMTAVGAMVGTPLYAAPEQIMGTADVDGRADLYALGCILFEMLAGEPPFAGSLASLIQQHTSVVPRAVRELRPSVPREVSDAIAKALAKRPEDRHESAAQFAEALAHGPAYTTPSAPEPPRPHGGLPRQRTRFIGREREIQEAVRLMAGMRLLTLTGIGGCGKTRLALQVAEALVPSFPDGVWFVDLAPIQDAERVVVAAATTLGVHDESAGGPLLERLAARLASQHTLIVLDNCEHVLGAAAELAEALLAACPHLAVLATSREGLGIAGEQLMALRSLSLPAAGADDLQGVQSSDAARLFVDRARLALPQFVLDASNARPVAEICRRLDGIPLAIELAAARVRVLSVEEILLRLNDRFRLLTGGSRTALPRHQTLRATIKWSYDQLAPEEQHLLRRLAVFAGGWTLDGAVRIAGEGADEFAVLDLLSHLTDKSLVTTERSGAGSTRYSMLETVRQYAQEELNNSGEGDDARTRHLAYFVDEVNRAEPRTRRFEDADVRSWVDLERENLLAAHAWCDHAPGGADAGLALAAGVRSYWLARGLPDLGYEMITRALGRPGATESRARVNALNGVLMLAGFLRRYDAARRFAEELLAIAREQGDTRNVAKGLSWLGYVSQCEGDLAAARAHFAESVFVSRAYGDKALLAFVLGQQSALERMDGDLDKGEALSREALALNREDGRRVNTVSHLVTLATISITRGSIGDSRELLRESLDICERLGERHAGFYVLSVTAWLAALAGEWRTAARWHGASLTVSSQMNIRLESVDEQVGEPLLARTCDALGEEAFAATVAAGRALSYEDAMAEARDWLERAAF